MLLQTHLACPTFPITVQLLFTSRLEPGTSRYHPPASSLRCFCPFVFGLLPLIPLCHCCLLYLPSSMKTQPIPKFQNVFAPEIAKFMPCLFGKKLYNFFFCVVRAYCLPQGKLHAIDTMPCRPWQPWKTMVSRAIFCFGCEVQNCITVHCASNGVADLSKKHDFDCAPAMAAMAVTPFLYASG